MVHGYFDVCASFLVAPFSGRLAADKSTCLASVPCSGLLKDGFLEMHCDAMTLSIGQTPLRICRKATSLIVRIQCVGRRSAAAGKDFDCGRQKTPCPHTKPMCVGVSGTDPMARDFYLWRMGCVVA